MQDLCSGTYHQGRAEGDRAAHVESYKLVGRKGEGVEGGGGEERKRNEKGKGKK